MHVLTVLDHPNPNSFSAAAARYFMEGARAAGHTTELADLHAEGFSPTWSMEDISSNGITDLPPDLPEEHARVARADAICLVFPLYWWGMPAMMKGWMDRVWCWGWAYDQLDTPDASLQPPRSGLLLVPAGASSDEIDSTGQRAALETAWINGTFGYFGLAPRHLELLCGATGSAPRRDALLTRCYDLGFTLPAPHDRASETSGENN